LSGHENCFTKRVPQKHSSILHLVDVATLFEIRAFQSARFFSHKFSLQGQIEIVPERRRARNSGA
jgi:hypothetical protein